MTRYYLALGDSITAGYGVGGRSFAAMYYSHLLQIDPNLRYVNYGVKGLTTLGLVNMLATNARLRSLVVQADIISITIGSNDLLRAAAGFMKGSKVSIPYVLSVFERNLDTIGGVIRSLNPELLVKAATIYNPLPAGPFRLYTEQAQAIIDQANKIIVHWAKKFKFLVVPVDRIFQGREAAVIGKDFVHPSFLGHQFIANEYAQH